MFGVPLAEIPPAGTWQLRLTVAVHPTKHHHKYTLALSAHNPDSCSCPRLVKGLIYTAQEQAGKIL